MTSRDYYSSRDRRRDSDRSPTFSRYADRDWDRDRRPPPPTRDERERIPSDRYTPRDSRDTRDNRDTARDNRDAARDSRDLSRGEPREGYPHHSQPDQEHSESHECSKMEPEDAAAQVAKLHFQLQDLLTEKVKWSTKKDAELKGLRRRDQDYKKIAAGSQFPAVAESFQRYQQHHKQVEAAIEKELAKVNSQLQNLTENYAQMLVKALPISEIKTRHIIDAAKGEISRAQESASDGRVEKLEQQFSSLVEAQKKQAEDLSAVKKENEELRARNALYEAQATELASLKTHHEQLQLRVDSQGTHELEIIALKQEREQLVAQISDIRTQLAGLVERFDSQQANFNKSLGDVRTQTNTNAALTNEALREDLVTLVQRVDMHDNQLSSFDATEYTEAMDKLLGYPSWDDLDSRLSKQQDTARDLQNLTISVVNLREDVEKRLVSAQKASDETFTGFMSKIVETCASIVEDAQTKATQVEDRVKALEALVSSTSRAASVAGATSSSHQAAASPTIVNENSSVVEVKTALSALKNDFNILRNDINAFQTQAMETRTAHEIMIHGLDTQFKNMNTMDMAQIILENLKRLPQSTVSLDMQNFHERLANLEEFQRDQTRQRQNMKGLADCFQDDMRAHPKRSMPQGQSMGQKRQKIDGMNGVGNGHIDG